MKKTLTIILASLLTTSVSYAEQSNNSIFGEFIKVYTYTGKVFPGERDNNEYNIIFNDFDGDKTTPESVILLTREFHTKSDPVTGEKVDTLIEQYIQYISIDSIECIPAPIVGKDYSFTEMNYYNLYGHGERRWSEYYNPKVQASYNKLSSIRRNEIFKERITPEFYQFLYHIFEKEPSYIKQRQHLLDKLQAQKMKVLSTNKFVREPCCDRVMWDNVYVLADKKKNKSVVYEQNLVKEIKTSLFESHKVQFYPDTLFVYRWSDGVRNNFSTNLSGKGIRMNVRYWITSNNDTVLENAHYEQKRCRVRFYDQETINYLQKTMGDKFITVEVQDK